MKLKKFKGNTPSYKVISTNYSKGGAGPLVGKTLKLIGKFVDEEDKVRAFMYVDDTKSYWKLNASASGKIQIKGEAARIYKHPELGHWNTLPGYKPTLFITEFEEVK